MMSLLKTRQFFAIALFGVAAFVFSNNAAAQYKPKDHVRTIRGKIESSDYKGAFADLKNFDRQARLNNNKGLRKVASVRKALIQAVASDAKYDVENGGAFEKKGGKIRPGSIFANNKTLLSEIEKIFPKSTANAQKLLNKSIVKLAKDFSVEAAWISKNPNKAGKYWGSHFGFFGATKKERVKFANDMAREYNLIAGNLFKQGKPGWLSGWLTKRRIEKTDQRLINPPGKLKSIAVGTLKLPLTIPAAVVKEATRQLKILCNMNVGRKDLSYIAGELTK